MILYGTFKYFSSEINHNFYNIQLSIDDISSPLSVFKFEYIYRYEMYKICNIFKNIE